MPLQNSQRLPRQAAQPSQVRPADDHGQVGRGPGHGFGHHVNDGLREVEIGAGNLRLQAPRDLLHELRLAHARRPLVVGLERHKQLVAVGAEGIRAACRCGRIASRQGDFGELLQHAPDLRSFIGGFFERHTGREVGADPDGAFVELRQKFRAEGGGQQHRPDHRREADGHRQLRAPHGDPQRANLVTVV